MEILEKLASSRLGCGDESVVYAGYTAERKTYLGCFTIHACTQERLVRWTWVGVNTATISGMIDHLPPADRILDAVIQAFYSAHALGRSQRVRA